MAKGRSSCRSFLWSLYEAHQGAGDEATQDNARAGDEGAPCHKGQDASEDEGEQHLAGLQDGEASRFKRAGPVARVHAAARIAERVITGNPA